MTDIMTERRYGRFSIAAYMMEDAPDAVLEIMAECIVLRCEYHYPSAAFRYVAASAQFAPTTANNILPRYEWLITPDGPVARWLDQ